MRLVALVFIEDGFGPLEVYHGDAARIHRAELNVFRGEVEGGFIRKDGYSVKHVLKKLTVARFDFKQGWLVSFLVLGMCKHRK